MSGNVAETVSVVMPCYNGAQFIAQALDSALAQTHRPVEILVVDDGSKDNSAELVNDYIQRFPDRGLRLIQQPNAGEPAARNTGIFASTGTWVAQLDTDDWWEPQKLEMQLAAAKEAGPECVMVHTGVIGHLPDGRLNPSKGKSKRVGWCTKALLDPESIGHPSIMVRKTALEKIGGYDPDFKQACDIDLYFRLSAVGTFVHVPDHLLHYRYHAGQMSASPVKQIRFHHRAVHKFFEQHPDKLKEIGKDYVSAKLAEHVGVKLESLYWRRNLVGFRELLAYAKENNFDNAAISAWRKRARWPNWVIRLKDRLTGGRK